MTFADRAAAAMTARRASIARFQIGLDAKVPADAGERAAQAAAHALRDERRAAVEAERRARAHKRNEERRAALKRSGAGHGETAAEHSLGPTKNLAGEIRAEVDDAVLKITQKEARDRRYAARKARKSR